MKQTTVLVFALFALFCKVAQTTANPTTDDSGEEPATTSLKERSTTTPDPTNEFKNKTKLEIPRVCSVMLLPTEVHIGNAFFIKPHAMLTTASTIFGLDLENLVVNCFEHQLNVAGDVYTIKKIVIHPEFDPTHHVSDLAFMVVKPEGVTANAPAHVPLSLPQPYNLRLNDNAMFYRWHTEGSDQHIYLKLGEVKVISNMKASLIFRQCVDQYMVCVEPLETDLGPSNDGVPLVVQRGENYVVEGIYNRFLHKGSHNISCYNQIAPFASWISLLL